MNLLRLGNHVINIDQVTNMSLFTDVQGQRFITVYFAVAETAVLPASPLASNAPTLHARELTLYGKEAEALWNWIESNSTNLTTEEKH